MDSADCSQCSVTHKRETSWCSLSLLCRHPRTLPVSLFVYMFSSLLVPSLMHFSAPTHPPPFHNISHCALCLTLSCSYLVSFTCFRWLIALFPILAFFFFVALHALSITLLSVYTAPLCSCSSAVSCLHPLFELFCICIQSSWRTIQNLSYLT